MIPPDALYSEDHADDARVTPLRSLAAVLAALSCCIREDMATGTGVCDHVLNQEPPPPVPGAVAALALWAEALTKQLQLADACLEAGSRPAGARYTAPMPEVQTATMRCRAALVELAVWLNLWAEDAERQAEQLDKAARAVALGRATYVERDARLLVLPIGTAGDAA